MTSTASSPPRALRGVLSPVLTPFHADLSVDTERLLAQCRWLLGNDVGLAVFGTNSEGNSLSVGERAHCISALVAGGIDASRMMPGTGACALPDAVTLTRHAVQAGAGGVLVLPPFYYKAVNDDGLYAFFAELIERVGDPRLRLYLYHIPPVAVLGIPHGVIERLLDAYGPVVAGIKDSSGQWPNTAALIERFAGRGFNVFAGSESFLLQTLRAGGAGCISATANVNPAAIASLHRQWRGADADARQQQLDEVRTLFAGFPMIPAMKRAVALASGHAGWAQLRPPLVGLNEEQDLALQRAMTELGFSVALHETLA